MAALHPDVVGRLVEWMGPEPDAVLEEMDVRATREGFPTVGPEVGRALALCTRLSGAQSVLELGSGYGYSAYWIARVLPDGGTITLTERDGGLLDDARTYFERGGLADRAVFERGDALEFAESCTDPFDLVVLDHDTADYVAGFELVREIVKPNGALLIDNVAIYEDILTPDELLATLNGESPPNDRTRIIAELFKLLKEDSAFETYVLPIGEGLAISCRV